MKFWVDAQLPPALATWLSAQYDIDALSLRDLGLRDATDAEIESARQAGIVGQAGRKEPTFRDPSVRPPAG